MVIRDIKFCKSCSEPKLISWKGWPLKNPIPMLSILKGDRCEVCGGLDSLSNHDIKWMNYHGPHSTGLPDYWILVIESQGTWGEPYLDVAVCKKCGGDEVISYFETQSGQADIGCSCETCGTAKSAFRWGRR